MKLQNKFSILALLAAASLSFNACGDDDNVTPPVTCEQDPTAEGCEEPPVTCEEDPTQEGCEEAPVDCALDPTQEGCEEYCNENPGAVACLPTECTQLEAPDTSVCDEDTVKAVAAHALQLRDEAAAAIPTVEVEELEGGERILTFDARLGSTQTAACQSWLYLNLAAGEFVDLSDVEALTDNTWHLAFKRTEIRTNTANSGSSHAMLAAFEGADFSDVSCLTAAEFNLTDSFVNSETCEVATYGRGTVSTAFGQWYDYDMTTHTLAPKDVVYAQYFVGGNGKGVKFQIENLENNGVYTIRVAPIALGTGAAPCPVN